MNYFSPLVSLETSCQVQFIQNVFFKISLCYIPAVVFLVLYCFKGSPVINACHKYIGGWLSLVLLSTWAYSSFSACCDIAIVAGSNVKH